MVLSENPLHPFDRGFSHSEFYMQSEQHDFENKIVYYEAQEVAPIDVHIVCRRSPRGFVSFRSIG